MVEVFARSLDPKRRLDLLLHATRAVGVGVYDGLSASLASRNGFDFVWVSGFSISASLGLPDVGIIGPEDVLAVVQTAQRLYSNPIVVDMDAGYGDPVKLRHVAREMALAGATALCIEDNPTSKRCSLYDNVERNLVTSHEHATRVRAAREGVASSGVPSAIIARTEALVAGLGVGVALERAHSYVAAGADAVFLQTLDPSGGELLEFARRWLRRTPIFIAPTRCPALRKAHLFEAGVSHITYANHAVRASHAAISDVFSSLARAVSGSEVEARISTVAQLATDVGKELVEEFEQRLAQEATSTSSKLAPSCGKEVAGLR